VLQKSPGDDLLGERREGGGGGRREGEGRSILLSSHDPRVLRLLGVNQPKSTSTSTISDSQSPDNLTCP